jgi:hypothetical protein
VVAGRSGGEPPGRRLRDPSFPQLPTQFPLSYCRGNMKRSLLLALLLSGVAVRAEGPDDLYLESFSLIEQAATIGKSGQSKNAIELLKQAETRLRKIQASYPSWNAGMVKFRLGDVAERLANLDGTAAEAPGPAASKPTPDAIAAGQEDQIRVLRSQVEALTAKLKEALEMQSSGLTAAERARLEVKVANQQRELDVMKAALAQEKEKAAQAERGADPEGQATGPGAGQFLPGRRRRARQAAEGSRRRPDPARLGSAPGGCRCLGTVGR